MKRNKFFNTGGLYIALIMLVASFSLTSCLKDNGPGSVNFGDSPALVAFQYAGIGPVPYVAAIYGKSTDSSDVEITLSVASLTLKTPVTVTVTQDDAGANAYKATDTVGGKVDNIMPTSLYSLQNGGKITINPGQQIVKMRINYVGQNIDFDQNYIIGLKLVNASGAILTSNLNNAIVTVVLKSVYAGTYNVDGYVFRNLGDGTNDPSLGGNFSGFSQALSTIDKNTVTLAPLWSSGAAAAGVTGTQIYINPTTFAATVSSTGNATLKNATGYNSHYDPAKKIIYVSYLWGTSPNNRSEIDTLTLTGP